MARTAAPMSGLERLFYICVFSPLLLWLLHHTGTGCGIYSTASAVPTRVPSRIPTVAPTRPPTRLPTAKPTSSAPTLLPSLLPTPFPSKKPTVRPTSKPTCQPTSAPSTTPRSFAGYYTVKTYYGDNSCNNVANNYLTQVHIFGVCVNTSTAGLQESYVYTNTTGSVFISVYSTPDCSGVSDSGYPLQVGFTPICTQADTITAESSAFSLSSIGRILPTFADGVIVT
jgi:hypothetical protein